MAIFNSYVCLPEGISYNGSLNRKIIRQQLRVDRNCRGQVSLGLTEWRRGPNGAEGKNPEAAPDVAGTFYI
jgi:hypothetical protein